MVFKESPEESGAFEKTSAKAGAVQCLGVCVQCLGGHAMAGGRAMAGGPCNLI